MEYTLFCGCGKIRKFANRQGLWLAKKNNSVCRSCSALKRMSGEGNPFFGKKHTDKTKQKMSAKSNRESCKSDTFRKKMSLLTAGALNPRFDGPSNYKIWVEKYGKEKADQLNTVYKEKLSKHNSGVGNPMYGKPTPKGAGNGWSGWYKGWYFRSLRELAYAFFLENNSIKWESGEKVVILYTDHNGIKRTYRPDFIVGNKIVEIKPLKLKSSPKVRAKKIAADIYCTKNNMVYEIIDPTALSNSIIYELYISGDIKFIDRYDKIYREKYVTTK